MSLQFDRSFVCPLFIGRAEVLEAMRTLLDDAVAGTGRTVRVSGEAGIERIRVHALAGLARASHYLTQIETKYSEDRSGL